MARTAAFDPRFDSGFAPLARPRPAVPFLAWLLAIMALGRSRRSLLSLDDRMLRDVGLSRDEALRESRRPSWDAIGEAPWDVPAHWLR